MRHFLKETDFSIEETQEIFRLAKSYKAERGNHNTPLAKQSWGVLLYKNSTRTRISFEVGIRELGAHPVILNAQDTQINRGETAEDTGRLMSRYLHGLIIRTFGHEIIEQFAQSSSMPIINGLTDFNHPCQLFTDIFTLLEHYAPIDVDIECLRKRKVVYFGDTSSNMATSWIYTAAIFGIDLCLCGPEAYRPSAFLKDQLKKDGLTPNFQFETDPIKAAKDADVFYTDVWVSMGDGGDINAKKREMLPYQVKDELFEHATKDCLFLHCLPAHAGEEVTQEVLDGNHSVIFDEAENRLHVQKAIMAKIAEVNIAN